MSTLIITRGLPGAGKTTWARQFAEHHGYIRVNRDDTRMMLFGKKTGLTFEQEKVVTDTVQAAVRTHLKEGRNVVADDMNLRSKYVREWEKLAKSCFAEFKTAEFNISTEEAIERQQHRPEHDRVPADVIRSLSSKYTPSGVMMPVVKPAEPDKKTWIPVGEDDWDLPRAIIVDIDGTVALNTGGRDWYDLTRVHEDSVNERIAGLVGLCSSVVDHVIFLSGRDEGCRALTEKWIQENLGEIEEFGIYWTLIMRKSGDKRKDSQVKYELFDEHIRGKYNVWFALDDRNQVVEMWREIGLTCLQVAPGDF